MVREGISVAGLGKLGLCMAACFADKGFPVVGVDVVPAVVDVVTRGGSPMHEPDLADLLQRASNRMRATADYREAVQQSQVTFIVVPTPSREDGSYSTQHVEDAATAIGEVLREKDDFHVVVLTSTVLPGVTRGVLQPLLERVSGKRCGEQFGICYSPELIALGSVIRDFRNPDVVMIGESDPRSGGIVAALYEAVCDNSPTIVRTAYENVELAKIAINSFVTMKISFANVLASACERFPSGDADTVSRIVGLDSRIGGRYLKGGLGFGGPCFPRDNRAFTSFARSIGCAAALAEATDEVNESQVARLVGRVEELLGSTAGKKIAFLGLTYKPDTDIVEASQALEIAVALQQRGARLSVYDPARPVAAVEILGPNVEHATSVRQCLEGADLCVLATPWREFGDLKPEDFTATMNRPRLIDCWRQLRGREFATSIEYVALGLGPS